MSESPTPSDHGRIAGSDAITLAVPASAAYLRHIRVLAATVADDLGFAVDTIESLRVAVDELCALAIADADVGATLEVTFRGSGGAVVLEGSCGPVTDDPDIDPIAEQLLRSGSSSHELRRDGDACRFSLRAPRPSPHRLTP